MARLSGLAGLLLFILACSTGAHARAATLRRPPPGDRRIKTGTGKILARVSGKYCSEESTLSPASDSSTSAQSVSVLSAAAIQAVTTVAAAAGLAYHKQVATQCWVLLKGADGGPAATAAAIAALKQPSAEVMTAAAAASGPVIEDAYAESYRFLTTALPRKPARTSGLRATAKQQQRRNVTANRNRRRRAARPVQSGAGLPNECSSGACNSLWGMGRIKAAELWRLLVDKKKMPLPQTSFLKGMIIDAGIDFSHNDIKGQADTINSRQVPRLHAGCNTSSVTTAMDASLHASPAACSRCITMSVGAGTQAGIVGAAGACRTFYADNGNRPPGGKAAPEESHGTHCFGTVAGNWSPYDNQADRRGIAGVVGPAYGNIVSCNVFGDGDGASDSDIAACIRHAVTVKAHHAINCQDGRQRDYPAYAAAYYPDCILAVAAIGQDNDQLTEFSNYGQLVRIAAPQVVACIVSSADQTVTPYWPGANINGGVLDVLAAYNCLAGGSVDPPPPPATSLDCRSQQQVTVPVCVNKASVMMSLSLMVWQQINISILRLLAICCCLACRDEECYYGVAVGETCSAECDYYYDYFGDGYTTTCQADGTWSTPDGMCGEYSGGSSGVQCYNDCQVANCNGCRCGEDEDTGDAACQCNARQGFTDWTYTDEETGDEYSLCTWNLDSVKGYSACPRDIRAGAYVPLRAAGNQRPMTETCARVSGQGRTLSYAFQVNSPPGRSRNMCAVLSVTTSDETTQEMLLRYID
ncbi:hypothetical protein COO60DRAFT_1657259 [Scenedesmus sp. NREL 46B-D3]|nr:hypothetical protein COO60DRAFT_1657259 [Scenedesmus sp. NREL 46B-D3]